MRSWTQNNAIISIFPSWNRSYAHISTHTHTHTHTALPFRSMDFIMGPDDGSYFLSQWDCSGLNITQELAPAVGAQVMHALTRDVRPREPGSVRAGRVGCDG